ncbi:unnamed protein product, partial [Closterium sp. NIES-54]
RLQLREQFGQDLPILCLHSDRGGELSSDLLRDFCRGEGILQSFMLPVSPLQNGIAERRIGLVMEVARTSMIHAAAPHFMWLFAVRYAAHQLNLWPHVSLLETSPTLRWTGEVGDASVFRFYHPTLRRIFPSQDVTFDEMLPFYSLFPYCSAPPPPSPLFLAPGPPPVDPLPPQGLAPSGVPQVGPLPGTAPVEVAVGSGAARGAASGGAASGGAQPGGAESEGAGSGGAELGGAEHAGVDFGGAEPEGVEPGGAESERAESGGAEPRGAASSGGSAGASPRLSPQQLREWLVCCARLWTGAIGAGDAGGTGGPAATSCGTVGVGVGGAGVGGTGVGGAGGAGAGAVNRGAGGAGGTVRSLTPPLLCPPPDQTQPPLLSASPLPAPSPFTEQSGGLTERREPAFRPVLPVHTTHRVPRSRPPPVPSMHAMELRPSSVPLRVSLPAPPESSLPEVSDPESDLPAVARLLATAVTDPSFESAAASALGAELHDFAAASRLDYASALVAESESASPPSLRSECSLGTDILEDRQEEFECLAAAVLRFASMLLALEGDLDAPDIPTPRSYAEAITGPYSSQRQAAIDAEMASWKSTGTYVDEVPPRGANIVDGMWIFRVKRPPGSPPAFKARYVARGFTFLQGSLHEEIWLRRPLGFTRSFLPGTQWSLKRPVYGLRQAPREWHDTLRSTLAALGFAPSTADPHRKVHWDAVKRVLRYLCNTSGMGLVLGGRGPVVLTGHADASGADDSATQRLSQGYTFSLSSGSVSWRSTRSSFVLSSSCEAEIYAGAMAAQEVRWLTYLLTDLGKQPRLPPVMYIDNKAMIALCQEHRTKHIADEDCPAGAEADIGTGTEAGTAEDVFPEGVPSGDDDDGVEYWSRDGPLEKLPIPSAVAASPVEALCVGGATAGGTGTVIVGVAVALLGVAATRSKTRGLCSGLAPSGVPQVGPLPGTAPVEVAVGSGAARGAASGGAASGGAQPGGAESEGAGSGGAELGGAEHAGVDFGGAEPEGVEPGGAESERAESGGAEPRGAASSGGSAGASPRLSPQQLREWLVCCARLWTGAIGAGDAGGTGGPAATSCGTVGVGVGGAGVGGTGVGGAGGAGAGAVNRGAGGAGGTVRSLTPPLLCPPPDQTQPPLLSASPLPAPSPFTEQSGGLTERREPAFRPVLPVHTTHRVPRSRPPPVPSMHAMELRPSSVPLRVSLPAPPESSLPEVSDPESDLPAVARLLATAVTDPSFESAAASALGAELHDFAAASRLDYASALVAESESASPPSLRSECSLGTDILEDRQEEFECLAAAVLRFASMLLALEGDLDAPDIPTPRSYAEAITGPYSSQRQAAIDAEMASWKSTGTYVDEVPPRGANIVDGMWIFRVKRPPGSPPAFKARYVARGFTFLQGSLHEEIWLRRPLGFTRSFLPGTQWSLKRPVYGLRQAPREWHDTLRSTLAALGFAPSTADPSLFLRTDTSLPPFYVLVYIDDLPTPLSTGHSLSAPPSDESVEPSGPYPELMGCLMYLMTCTRPDLTYPLSLLARYVAPARHRKVHWDAVKRVLRYLCNTSGMGLVLGGRGPVVLTGHADASGADDSATQRLSQGYTFSLSSGSVSWRSTRSSFVLSSSCEAEIYAGAMAAQEPTPLSTGHSLSAPPSDESVEPSGPYPELMGCLMYLMTCTRPDLTYPLSLLARYVAPARHRKVHWDAVKRVLRYLCNTSGMGLVLGGRGPVVLTGHADASGADDSATQRLSQGYTFSLSSGSVSWRSTRSSFVLSSSCEAEIYAGAMAAQEVRWLTYLLTDLGKQPRLPPVMYIDNEAMIALCQEHRTKHIADEDCPAGAEAAIGTGTEAGTAEDVFPEGVPSGDDDDGV